VGHQVERLSNEQAVSQTELQAGLAPRTMGVVGKLIDCKGRPNLWQSTRRLDGTKPATYCRQWTCSRPSRGVVCFNRTIKAVGTPYNPRSFYQVEVEVLQLVVVVVVEAEEERPVRVEEHVPCSQFAPNVLRSRSPFHCRVNWKGIDSDARC
jgi:hypothetical protein